MAITKELIENVNGTDLLFATTQPYVPGSLRVVEIRSSGVEEVRQVEELSEIYFKIDPAPSAGSTLEVFYDSREQVPIGIDGLSPWEKKTIEKIVVTLQYHSQTLANIQEALSNRVSTSDFETAMEILDKQINELRAALSLS